VVSITEQRAKRQILAAQNSNKICYIYWWLQATILPEQPHECAIPSHTYTQTQTDRETTTKRQIRAPVLSAVALFVAQLANTLVSFLWSWLVVLVLRENSGRNKFKCWLNWPITRLDLISVFSVFRARSFSV